MREAKQLTVADGEAAAKHILVSKKRGWHKMYHFQCECALYIYVFTALKCCQTVISARTEAFISTSPNPPDSFRKTVVLLRPSYFYLGAAGLLLPRSIRFFFVYRVTWLN